MSTLATETKSKKNIKTGWFIVLACMLIQAVPFGIASNIQSLFIYPVTMDKGFEIPQFSLIFTIGTVVSAVAAPFIGMAFSKFKLKMIYIIGCILSGGGFLLFSMCNELWQYYAVAGIVQVGTCAISATGVPLIISSWFDEAAKGKALGIAFAGGGIGNIFLQPMTMHIIGNYGYKTAYFAFGAMSLVVGVIVTLFMLRMPKDSSEIVRGEASKTNENTDTMNFGYTLKEAKNIKYFWMLTIGFVFIGLYVSAYSVQHAAYFQGELGYSDSVVGQIGSVFAALSLFGSIFGGVLFDKLGTTKSLIVSAVLVIVAGGFLLMSEQSVTYAMIFSALKGISVYAYMIGPAYLTGSLFGNKDFASIIGIVNLMFAVGFAVGSSSFGLLAVNFGYRTSWMIVIGFAAIAYALLIGASIGMAKLNKKK